MPLTAGHGLVMAVRAAGVTVPVVISDHIMPGMKGDEFLVRVHALLPDTRTILLTGQAGVEAVGRAINGAVVEAAGCGHDAGHAQRTVRHDPGALFACSYGEDRRLRRGDHGRGGAYSPYSPFCTDGRARPLFLPFLFLISHPPAPT